VLDTRGVYLKNNLPNFKGKILIIYIKGKNDEYPTILSHAKFEMQADRLFLVGKYPKIDSKTRWNTNKV
jgi:hypothetical protein